MPNYLTYPQALELFQEVDNAKQNTLIAGSGIAIENDVIRATGGGGGTSDYPDLTNKPQINSVELVGEVSLSDLGVPNVNDDTEAEIADADSFFFYDASAFGNKKSLWSNIKSVLKTYFDTIYNGKLTFDNTPTASSNNPVKSQGIKTYTDASQSGALSDIKSTVGWDGKNLGSYANYHIEGDIEQGYRLVSTGGCLIAKVKQNTQYTVTKKSGQGNRFRINLFKYYPTTAYTQDAIEIIRENDRTEYTANSGEYNYLVFTYDFSNSVISQDAAEAMVREASITDSTYEPYHKSVEDWYWENNSNAGTKNMVINMKTTPTVDNDVTYTPQADGSITVSGTPTARSAYNYLKINNVKAGVVYKVSGLANTTNLRFEGVSYYNNGSTSSAKSLETESDTTFSLDSVSTQDANHYYMLIIKRSNNNVACTGTIYPMVQDARDTDSTYVPYAMTNRELTDIRFNRQEQIKSGADLNNYITPGVYNLIGTGISHAPLNFTADGIWGSMIVVGEDASGYKQIIPRASSLFMRSYGGSPVSWTHWYQYSGTDTGS